MLSRIHTLPLFVCLGLGLVSQVSWASPPDLGLSALFRPYKDRVSSSDERADTASAAAAHRLAKTYAEQNDTRKANTQFTLALQNASLKQVTAIAIDYAAFLSETGDLRKAELILRQALAQSPDDKELIRMLARCLVLQEKMMEGLRYFKSIYSESEAKAEVAAIYREQGDTDTLAAVERKWGTSIAAPESVTQDSVLVAATPKAATLVSKPNAPPKPVTLMPRLTTIPETMVPETAAALPATLITKSEVAAMPKPSAMPVLPPVLAAVVPNTAVPNTTVPNTDVPMTRVHVPDSLVAVAPVAPLSKSEFFDSKVPIPVPRQAPIPMVAVSPQKSAPIPQKPAPLPMAASPPKSSLQPMLTGSPKSAPVPMATYPATEKSDLINPVKLSVLPVLAEKLPKPAIHTRKHYIVNVGAADNMDVLFPIKPVAASLAVEK